MFVYPLSFGKRLSHAVNALKYLLSANLALVLPELGTLYRKKREREKKEREARTVQQQ